MTNNFPADFPQITYARLTTPGNIQDLQIGREYVISVALDRNDLDACKFNPGLYNFALDCSRLFKYFLSNFPEGSKELNRCVSFQLADCDGYGQFARFGNIKLVETPIGPAILATLQGAYSDNKMGDSRTYSRNMRRSSRSIHPCFDYLENSPLFSKLGISADFDILRLHLGYDLIALHAIPLSVAGHLSAVMDPSKHKRIGDDLYLVPTFGSRSREIQVSTDSVDWISQHEEPYEFNPSLFDQQVEDFPEQTDHQPQCLSGSFDASQGTYICGYIGYEQLEKLYLQMQREKAKCAEITDVNATVQQIYGNSSDFEITRKIVDTSEEALSYRRGSEGLDRLNGSDVNQKFGLSVTQASIFLNNFVFGCGFTTFGKDGSIWLPGKHYTLSELQALCTCSEYVANEHQRDQEKHKPS